MIAHWVGFHILIVALLAVDVWVFRKREMKWRVALVSSLAWIALALAFNGYIFLEGGAQKGTEFFTAYLLEKSLSVDNLFVFLLIFTYFKVPEPLQHRLLFLGILGALVLRLGMILAGISLISSFYFVTYLFGIIVGWTGLRMILFKQEKTLQNSRLLGLLRRCFSVREEYAGDRFFVRVKKRLYLTPLLLALIMIEGSDILFALDSIPAVLAVTNDVFIAYTSNVFAVLGLRELFFLIAPWLNLLKRLKLGLGAILLFIGLKMLIEPFFVIPLGVSLAVIAAILLISTVYAVRRRSL